MTEKREPANFKMFQKLGTWESLPSSHHRSWGEHRRLEDTEAWDDMRALISLP